MKRIPKGQERSGIKIRCHKCDRQVYNTCPLSGKRISACHYQAQHKYHLLCHIPGTLCSRRSKISQAETFEEAMLERAAFIRELTGQNYHKVEIPVETKITSSFYELCVDYLNAISGNSELEIHNRLRSKEHVSHNRKVLMRFGECMEGMGYTVRKLDITAIGDREVNEFLLFLRKIKDSQDLVNKHFVGMKTFFNWVIGVKKIKIDNPFGKTELKVKRTKMPSIVSKEIFNKLLKVVTPANGFAEFKNASGKEKGKNLHRDYLIAAFRLALETGCRSEELTTLKWSNLRTIDEGIEIFDITNLKVTRIQSSVSDKEYNRPIPVTASLKSLLVELGYHKKKGRDEFVIPRPDNLNEVSMAKHVGRAFNHYIKLVDTGGQKVEFKDLRKTYFTFITKALGDKAKMFTGHADNKVLEIHYVAKEFLAGDLVNFNLYNSAGGTALIAKA